MSELDRNERIPQKQIISCAKKDGVEVDFNFKKLLNEYEKLRHIIEYFDQGIVITDPNLHDNPIIFMNTGFTALTKYEYEDAIGKIYRFLQGKDTDRDTVASIRAAIKNEEAITVEILNYKKRNAFLERAKN